MSQDKNKNPEKPTTPASGAVACYNWVGIVKRARTFRRFCCMEFMMLTFRDGTLVWCDTLEPAILPDSDYQKNDWIIVEKL